MEQWRKIKGYETRYEVSDLGRVRRLESKKTMRPWLNKEGYHQISLYEKAGRVFLVARLVAQAFIPNPENAPQVNHKNGIKTLNRAVNLEWCTGKENQRHSINTLGNKWYGEHHKLAKLTYEQAQTIRGLYAKEGTTARTLAKRFKVSKTTIFNIISGTGYRKP